MRRLLACSGMAIGVSLVFGGGIAGATLSPQCQASGTITGDDISVTVDAASGERFTIPRAGSVDYEGSIDVASPSEDMPYSGSIQLEVAGGLDLIPGLDDPEIGSWSWSGETDETSTAGTETYDLDLPLDLLGGIKATATGDHTQAGTTCSGNVKVKIGGSAVNAGSLGSAALTVAGGAGLAMAARGKP